MAKRRTFRKTAPIRRFTVSHEVGGAMEGNGASASNPFLEVDDGGQVVYSTDSDGIPKSISSDEADLVYLNILALRSAGESHFAIAKKLGVSRHFVGNVLNGKIELKDTRTGALKVVRRLCMDAVANVFRAIRAGDVEASFRLLENTGVLNKHIQVDVNTSIYSGMSDEQLSNRIKELGAIDFDIANNVVQDSVGREVLCLEGCNA